MINNLPQLNKEDVKNKTVFLRLDLDVPIQNNKIQDDSRLVAGLKTLEFLLEESEKVIICGHLGRPVGFDKELSLKPIALWFKNKLKVNESGFKMQKNGEFLGWEIGPKIFVLENIRFYEEEEKNDLKFARKLAGLADVYVNDAFAVSHRAHASLVGIPRYLPHFAGFRLKEEVENLTQVLENPIRPLVIIIGGAKISTKLPLVEKMYQFADYVLVGGKIAKEEKLLIDIQHKKIVNKRSMLIVADLTEKGIDITLKSLENFLQVIGSGKTIVWNGPIGKVEDEKCRESSERIAKEIIKTKAHSIIGGGDTIDFLKEIGLINKFSFVSTGGGAMLSLLAAEKLPGVEAIRK